jgi:hypothetical protein
MEFEPTGNVVETLRKARTDAIDAAIKSIF